MIKEKERHPLVEVVYVFRAELSRVYPMEEYWDIESISGRENRVMFDYHMKSRLMEEIKDLVFQNKLEDKIFRHERIIE